MPNKPPRIPGSQVAPNQRPFVGGGITASTHSTVPIDQATAGRTYRVRCKDWGNVWGENLSWEDAVKLKERVVTSKQSKTARVEDEDIPPPDWYLQQIGGLAEILPKTVAVDPDTELAGELVEAPDKGVALPAERRTYFTLDHGEVEVRVPSAGVISGILAGHELLVNGQPRPVPAQVVAGDRVIAHAVDPQIIAARERALAAARAAIPARAKPRPQYRDKTVRPRVPPKGPPPRDKTAGQQIHVRLTAVPAPAAPAREDILPSPLKVATIPDGKPLPDDAIGEDDVADLAVDLGGGPTDADIEHARRQRDAG